MQEANKKDELSISKMQVIIKLLEKKKKKKERKDESTISVNHDLLLYKL